MPLKNWIAQDVPPMVHRARRTLARTSPNEAVRYLVDAAVDVARRNGTDPDPQRACVQAIVQGRTEYGGELFAPLGLPIAVVAEISLTAARDAIHFIKNLQTHPAAAVQDADAHLRGLLHASTLLTAIVTNAAVVGLTARLFARDMTRQEILDELDQASMRCLLFQMVERDDSRIEHREPELPDETEVSQYLERGFAAALLDRATYGGALAALSSTFERMDDSFDEIFRAVAELLHENYEALTDITHQALVELKTLARTTFRSGDVEEALQLVECTQPLRIACDVCGILDDALDDTLYFLLCEAGCQDAKDVSRYLQIGALLGKIQRALQGTGYDEFLMANAVNTFTGIAGNGFWDAAKKCCAAEGFPEAGKVLDALQRSARVQPDSALATYAKGLCSHRFPNEQTGELVLLFAGELSSLTKARAASRYAATVDDRLSEVRTQEQRAAIAVELYEALPVAAQPVFRARLRQCADLQRLSPRHGMLLMDVYSALMQHVQEQVRPRYIARTPQFEL